MACKSVEVSTREKVHGVLTIIVQWVALPSIARGTMQIPLHPPFPSTKMVYNVHNEGQEIQANIGVRQCWATHLLACHLAQNPTIEASNTLLAPLQTPVHPLFLCTKMFKKQRNERKDIQGKLRRSLRLSDTPFGVSPGPASHPLRLAVHRKPHWKPHYTHPLHPRKRLKKQKN